MVGSKVGVCIELMASNIVIDDEVVIFTGVVSNTVVVFNVIGCVVFSSTVVIGMVVWGVAC